MEKAIRASAYLLKRFGSDPAVDEERDVYESAKMLDL
jgi:hypothetical protein